MVSLLLVAALQLTAQESQAMARDFIGPERYSNRLDCLSRSRRESADPASAPLYEANSVFVLPIRPHIQRNEEARTQVRFVRTMRDGRTWIREGRIVAARLEQWPHFSARIVEGNGEIQLESDPRSRGRVTFLSRYRASHGPGFEERGECRFVPEVPTNEASTR